MADLLATAHELMRAHPLVDGHNDLAWRIRTDFGADLRRVDLAAPLTGTHTDLPRLRRGGLGAQFWSVYVPGALQGEAAVATTLEQVDLVHRMIDRHPDDLELALTADDVESAFARGRIASLLGAEGGHSIAGSLGVLRMLHRLGVRYLTLTHNVNVPWADSATDVPAAGGLSAFGEEVVREMNRLGMLVDLSHVADSTARDALRVTEAPVVCSHSGARAVCDHPRNVPDDLLRGLAANGGVCMVTFVSDFVSPGCRAWALGLRAEMERRGLDPRDAGVRAEVASEYLADHPRPRAKLAQVTCGGWPASTTSASAGTSTAWRTCRTGWRTSRATPRWSPSSSTGGGAGTSAPGWSAATSCGCSARPRPWRGPRPPGGVRPRPAPTTSAAPDRPLP
jgi:membrane dipeptidase